MRVGGQRLIPAALPAGMSLYPLYRRLGGSQGRSWTGAENIASTRVRTHTLSLYRLRSTGLEEAVDSFE